VLPDDLVGAVDALAGNIALSPPALPQLAALEAFTPESLAAAEAAVARYGRSRARLLERLPALGWDRVAPKIPFPVRFGAERNALVFPARLLEAPLPTHDPLNWQQMLKLCDRLAQQVDCDIGYRRVGAELRHRGWVVNGKKVRRLMKLHDLNPRRRRRFTKTTDSALTVGSHSHVGSRPRSTPDSRNG
jgi:hypothetical protein